MPRGSDSIEERLAAAADDGNCVDTDGCGDLPCLALRALRTGSKTQMERAAVGGDRAAHKIQIHLGPHRGRCGSHAS